MVYSCVIQYSCRNVLEPPSTFSDFIQGWRAYTSCRRALSSVDDMAIYHFSVQVIGRSSGRSSVAAAYRAGERLHDERLDHDHDFRAKSGVEHSEIMLPEGAPERFADRATLWNEVEATEKRKDAQLAREVELSIPREMDKAQGIELVRDFMQGEFVERGMIADLRSRYCSTSSVLFQSRSFWPNPSGPTSRMVSMTADAGRRSFLSATRSSCRPSRRARPSARSMNGMAASKSRRFADRFTTGSRTPLAIWRPAALAKRSPPMPTRAWSTRPTARFSSR